MPKYTQSLDFIRLIPWPFLDHLILTPAPWPCVNCLCRPESRKVWALEWMPWNQIMASREEREASRREILGVLARKGFQVAESTNFYHGRLKYFLPHLKPRITLASKAAPRGPGGPSWVTASELQVNKRSSIPQTSKFFFFLLQICTLLTKCLRSEVLLHSSLKAQRTMCSQIVLFWPSCPDRSRCRKPLLDVSQTKFSRGCRKYCDLTSRFHDFVNL